ncbi:hypothetical protein M758_UG261600 [Ceratodon purpureus]|nr:hypothetical protein M758_UG261600 [Ceratodon purpureus]
MCVGQGRGASHLTGRRIVGLLSVDWLLGLPLPPRTHRSSGSTEAQWRCYLFRRHCGRFFGWTKRLDEGNLQGFSPQVNKLIWERFFPDPGDKHHGAREIGVNEEADGQPPLAIAGDATAVEARNTDQGDAQPPVPGSGGAAEVIAGRGIPCCGGRGAPAGRQPGPRRLPAWMQRGAEHAITKGKREGPARPRLPPRGCGSRR